MVRALRKEFTALKSANGKSMGAIKAPANLQRIYLGTEVRVTLSRRDVLFQTSTRAQP